MFSHLGKSGFEARKHNYENLLDVLQHAGLAVLWLDNQSGCKGVCDRVPHTDTRNLNLPDICPEGECFDEAMLRQQVDRSSLVHLHKNDDLRQRLLLDVVDHAPQQPADGSVCIAAADLKLRAADFETDQLSGHMFRR